MAPPPAAAAAAAAAPVSWNLQSKIQDFKFTCPEHMREIRDRVLRFVEDEVYPVEERLRLLHIARRAGKPVDLGSEHVWVAELQQKAKAKGLWALGHPKEIGGGGMPFRDYLYVNEIQGRSELAPLALGTFSLQDSLMLLNHASEGIKQTYLHKLVQAEVYPSFAMTEPDVVSSDPTGIQTSARLEGDEWVITGRKWFTTNAKHAAFTSVMVKTEHEQGVSPYASFSIILVPTNTPGYNIIRSTPVLGIDSHDHSEVVYDNVRVPASNLLGKRGAGFLISQERLGPGRIFHAMRWIGVMQRAFDIMCKRLVERKFRTGVLGDAQLMQQLVFDSYCDIQAHRLMTLAAAEKLDSGEYARIELAAAKAWGARALGRVVDRAMQSFGAKALTDDTPLGEMYRLARSARYYDGPDETHVENVGRLVLAQYKKNNAWDFALSKAVPAPRAPKL